MGDFVERRILVGLIYSDSYVSRVLPFLRLDLFSTKEAKVIAKTAIGVFQNYGKVVGIDIYGLLEGEKNAEVLQAFCDSITDEEREINVDVLVDETVEYFKRRALENLASNVEMYIAAGKVELAEKEISEYKPISKNISLAIDPFSEEAIKMAFDEKVERVVQYKGALGRLLNDLLVRDGFLAVMAPEKRGKTWFLLDIVMRSWEQGFKVAYFEVGDMSTRKLLRRMYSWVTKRPVGFGEYAEVTVPKLNCKLHVDNICKLPTRRRNESVCRECLKHHPEKFVPYIELEKKKMPYFDLDDVTDALGKLKKDINKRIKLSIHPAKSLTIREMDGILKTWKDTENFVPDVIVIDYADILAPEIRTEYRHQINETWMAMRRLSMEWHVLVVTATQSDVAGHDADVLKHKNFSEDKRKMAHVTGMIGLNQKEEEKQSRVYRVNIIVAREKEYFVGKTVTVGYSFDIGRPYLFSFENSEKS